MEGGRDGRMDGWADGQTGYNGQIRWTHRPIDLLVYE